MRPNIDNNNDNITTAYDMTPGRSHQLPEYSTDLHKKSFLIRCLYSFVRWNRFLSAFYCILMVLFCLLFDMRLSHLLSSVLWHCWMGGTKGIRPVNNLIGGVLAWLSVCNEVQTCMWPSWCHYHPKSLASVNSRLVLPLWYRLTRLVLDKGLLNGCVCVYVCVCLSHVINITYTHTYEMLF